MRAWLLLLAVLATFQTIVQVASTEDNNILSSTTTTAIQPFTRDSTTTTAIIKKPPSSLQDFQNIISTTKQKLNKQTVVYKTYNKSDKLSEKQENKNQEKQNQQQQEKDQENQNNKNIIVKIKNIEENEEINRNVLENEVMFEEESHKYNQNSDIYIKNSLKHKKMALIESEKIKNSKQNQKSQQTKQSNNLDEDRLLEENKESSSKHEHQHNHQHHQHQQHQQENLEPASQEQTTNTIISDKLKLYSTTTAATTTSSILSPITTPASSSPPPPPSSSSSSSKKLDLDLTVRETDDGSIIVESQQPQLDAVIPDEGPRTFSNQEIIAEKVKPDNETLVVIENSLLSLFNMKVPPKIDRSKIIIPEAMKQLYAQIMGHDLVSVNIPKPGLLTKSANTVRSFTHQGSKIDDRFQHHHRFRLYFDIKSIPVEEKLKAAELQLTRDAISHAVLNPRLANRTRYQVLVYDITRVGIKGKREPNYLLLDNKTIRLNSTDTISLDVQPAVNRWLASPKNNFGLLVEVRTSRSLKPAPHHHVRLRRSADEEHEHWQHKQPLLFTYTDDGRHKARSIRDINTRSKRAGHHRRTHRRKNNDEICRRHSLYVDFTDVGWSDWIVAPPGYDAYYCSGRCPFPIADHLNSTNHAVVQTLVNSINPGKVPKACCVPTQLEGISMLYLNDHSTVVLKNYQDMTVVGCGCR